MKYLAIYCVPQEYGAPFVHVVSLLDGKIVRTYDLPDGYYDSGATMVEDKILCGKTYTARKCGNKLPKVGEDYGRDCVITGVEYRKETDELGTWYHSKIEYRKYRRLLNERFSAKDDTFRKSLEAQGVDMRGWCVYKRRKTKIEDFLIKVLPYNIVNLIRC